VGRAQYPATLSRLTLSHVQIADGQMRIRLGREPVVLPAPLDTLIRVRPGQSRPAAMFQLATELPAAVLARMLGIHIIVAVTWQRASAGDWAAYAADISRRKGIGHDTPR
jgi:hypothetical protein